MGVMDCDSCESLLRKCVYQMCMVTAVDRNSDMV